MEPASTAFAPSRKPISRATSFVMRSPGWRPMKRRASRTRDSGRIFRNGDCSSWTANACFRVPSKTGSPVVLTKSARTTVSFSVRALARRERRNRPPATRTAIRATAAKTGIVQDFFGAAGDGASPVSTAGELAAAATAEADDTGGGVGWETGGETGWDGCEIGGGVGWTAGFDPGPWAAELRL